MNVATALVLTGLGLRSALSLILAGVFGGAYRRYPRPFIRSWAFAWIAYAASQVAGAFGVWVQRTLPPDAPARVAVWAITTVFLYWAAALVVIGAVQLSRNQGLRPGRMASLLTGLAILGVLQVLLTASPTVAAELRGLVTLALRSLLVAVTLFAAAAWIARSPAGHTGPVAVAVGTAFLALTELAVVGAVAASVLQVRTALLYVAPLVGVLAPPLLGSGMLIWFVEEERERVLQLTAEREKVERQRTALLDQLRQSQKMEAVGRLAGGVIHDLKNLLTVIGAWLPDLRDGSAADRALGVEQIEAAYQRAVALSRQLLTFARQAPSRPQDVELGQVVRDVGALLGRSLPPGARLEVSAEGRWPARVDPDQLAQVLMNLGLNAGDAIRSGGRVTLSVCQRALAAPTPAGPDVAPAGVYDCIEVTDDGSGMDETVQVRLFEPFFTTKPEGRGTGLGLSTAYGLIRQAGGYLAVRSAPGQGSTFSVLLPAPAAPADPGAADRALRASA